jgi:hypothetical protein
MVRVVGAPVGEAEAGPVAGTEVGAPVSGEVLQGTTVTVVMVMVLVWVTGLVMVTVPLVIVVVVTVLVI